MQRSLGSVWLAVCLAAAAAACSRSSSSSAPAAGSAAAAPAGSAAPATAAPAAPAAAAERKIDPREAEILAVVKRWNDALAARDARLLEDVYGARVRLYMKEIERAAAIQAKAAALAAAKDYTQSISAIEIDLRAAARPRAAFQKQWTANGKAQAVVGSLVLAQEAGRWVVVEESDARTDERRARAAASADSCEALVMDVVASTPEAARLLAGPTDPAHGHSSNGMRLGGGPPESPTYGVAVHEDHGDRLATLAWFEVDPKTGKIINQNDDTEHEGDPALVKRMIAACAK